MGSGQQLLVVSERIGMKQVQIILASTRNGRLGEAVAHWTEKVASTRSNIQFSLVDLLDYPLPGVDSDISPVTGKSAKQLVTAWAAKMAEADGYLIVSPEYNHGYSGVLKNALDSLKAEWAGKPVGIVGYGGIAGGARSIEQLRLVFIELKMRPTYSAVLLPMIWESLDANGEPSHSGAQKQLDALLDELSELLK